MAHGSASGGGRLDRCDVDQSKVHDARSDYEYEARKRLYAEIEPLIFLLVGTCDEAAHRVRSLARSARGGTLVRWLSTPGYYTLSTMYKLYAPAAVARLMAERLTMVDLGLDAALRVQYRLARALLVSYTDAHDVAELAPHLPYFPDETAWRDLRVENPARYWRQGLTIGRTESAADALIVREADRQPRLITWGEFENAMHDKNSAVYRAFDYVADLFAGFHPRQRPVMWRLLIAQSIIFRAFGSLGDRTSRDDPRFRCPLRMPDGPERRPFDWRQAGTDDDVSDRDVLETPFDVAETYLRQRAPEAFLK